MNKRPALNVMVADDSATSRTYVRKNLMVAEIVVKDFVEAANGQLALELLREQPIDVLFVDIHMPVMNGIELIRQLEIEGIKPRVKIVVISSDHTLKRQDELKDLGVTRYVKKPFTPEQFSKLIDEMFCGG
ncbi:MAG: hypothetical protein A2603_12050 [Bdellovibrionales bacterium RIFOXYD1_FULL_55_31]|nr:MAG: hypothetical protein A2603_12050 [Bdellovibrionales bacterium RIFOXYD1_FULL_55_31]